MDVLFGYHWSLPDAFQPALLNTMYVSAGPRTGRGHLKHAQWVLDYTFEAAGHYRVGQRPGPWLPRRARVAHLYAPGTPYWEDARATTRFHAAAIVFQGGEAAGLGALLCPERGFAEFEDPQGELGELLIGSARIASQLGEEGFWPAQAEFCRLVGALLHSRPLGPGLWRVAPAAAEPDPAGLAPRVDAFLRSHLAEPVTLAAIARELHLSVSSLSHRYRQETGLTPLARLAALRIDQARQLLRLGHPLKSVAQTLGFYDAFHLSRVFKRQTGCSPRAYLLRERGEAGQADDPGGPG